MALKSLLLSFVYLVVTNAVDVNKFVINQHACDTEETVLICKYSGFGVYVPDRKLSGFTQIQFEEFHDGMIHIEGTQMPDLVTVNISNGNQELCDQVNVPDSVKIYIGDSRCHSYSTSNEDRNRVTDTIESTGTSTSTTKDTSTSTTKRSFFEEIIKEKSVWIYIAVIFIVTTVLLLLLFLILRIRRNRNRTQRIPSLEEIHFERFNTSRKRE